MQKQQNPRSIESELAQIRIVQRHFFRHVWAVLVSFPELSKWLIWSNLIECPFSMLLMSKIIIREHLWHFHGNKSPCTSTFPRNFFPNHLPPTKQFSINSWKIALLLMLFLMEKCSQKWWKKISAEISHSLPCHFIGIVVPQMCPKCNKAAIVTM